MSEERKPGLSAEPEGNGPKAFGTKIIELLTRGFHSVLQSAAIMNTIKLFGWIASILIIGGLCWALTQPVRTRFLIRAVNRVLEQYGDSRRVAELTSPAGGSSLIGSWHTMIKARQQGTSTNENFTEGTKALVFSFIAEGTIFPCVAVVDPMGRVQEFIPLNIHGKKIFSRISPGIFKLYIRRIEGSES